MVKNQISSPMAHLRKSPSGTPTENILLTPMALAHSKVGVTFWV